MMKKTILIISSISIITFFIVRAYNYSSIKDELFEEYNFDCKQLNKKPILIQPKNTKIKRNLKFFNIEFVIDDKILVKSKTNDTVISYEGDGFKGDFFKISTEESSLKRIKNTLYMFLSKCSSDREIYLKIFNTVCNDAKFYYSASKNIENLTLLKTKSLLFPNVSEKDTLFVLDKVDPAVIFYKLNKTNELIALIEYDDRGYFLYHEGNTEVFYNIVKSIRQIK